MRTRTRTLLLAATIAVVMTLLASLVGCGVAPLRGTGTTPPPPLTGLVFAVHPGAGLAPSLAIARMAPSLLVYGDGRVLRNTAPWGETAAYEQANASPTAIAVFIAELERDPLFTGKARLGTPSVTDLGVTVVRIHGASGERSVSAYGLAEQFDRYVGWTARRQRAALRTVIDRATGLAGDAAFEPSVPTLVAVRRLTGPGSATTPAPAWPGPDLATLLTSQDRSGRPCGLVHGDDAAALAAAGIANRAGLWTVDDEPVLLAINTDPEAATWCAPR